MEKGIPIQSSAQEQKHARALAILKESMLQISRSRNYSPSHQQFIAKLIDARLPALIPNPLCNPNHPPYAQMIIAAVQESTKKTGPTKASISRFIQSNYQELPLAHDTLLAHHLDKLLQAGELVSVKKFHTFYTLPTVPTADRDQRIDEGLVAQRNKSPEMVGGGDDVGTKHRDVVTESVDKVTFRGRGRRPKEKNAQPKRRRLILVESESMGDDDDDDDGSRHTEVLSEPVDSLQHEVIKPCQGRDSEEKRSLHVNDGLVAQSNKTLTELESMGGEDGEPKHMDVQTESVDSLQSTPIVRGRGRPAKEKTSLHVNDGPVAQCEKLPVTLTELESMGAEDAGTKHKDVQTESVDSLQNKLIEHGRGRHKENNQVEQHQNALVTSSEKLQSKAVVVYDAAADDDPANGSHSLSQQRRGRGRPPKKKLKTKEIQIGSQDAAAQDDTGSSVNLFKNQPPSVSEMEKPLQIKLPVRGRGRPLNRKSEVKQRQKEAEEVSEAIPSELEISESQEQQQESTPVMKEHLEKPQEETELVKIATATPERNGSANKERFHSSRS